MFNKTSSLAWFNRRICICSLQIGRASTNPSFRVRFFGTPTAACQEQYPAVGSEVLLLCPT